MLTGIDPTEGVAWTFEAPHVVESSVLLSVSNVVMRALALDPSARFQDAEKMLFALRGASGAKVMGPKHHRPSLCLGLARMKP